MRMKLYFLYGNNLHKFLTGNIDRADISTSSSVSPTLVVNGLKTLVTNRSDKSFRVIKSVKDLEIHMFDSYSLQTYCNFGFFSSDKYVYHVLYFIIDFRLTYCHYCFDVYPDRSPTFTDTT